MKISRKITACDMLPSVEDCPVCQAIDCIKQAIECLAKVAESNDVAKESIANLAVVVFDLQQD